MSYDGLRCLSVCVCSHLNQIVWHVTHCPAKQDSSFISVKTMAKNFCRLLLNWMTPYGRKGKVWMSVRCGPGSHFRLVSLSVRQQLWVECFLQYLSSIKSRVFRLDALRLGNKGEDHLRLQAQGQLLVVLLLCTVTWSLAVFILCKQVGVSLHKKLSREDKTTESGAHS